MTRQAVIGMLERNDQRYEAVCGIVDKRFDNEQLRTDVEAYIRSSDWFSDNERWMEPSMPLQDVEREVDAKVSKAVQDLKALGIPDSKHLSTYTIEEYARSGDVRKAVFKDFMNDWQSRCFPSTVQVGA